MQDFVLQNKTTTVSISIDCKNLVVTVDSDIFYLPFEHYNKLASYKSVSALVKYAKANSLATSSEQTINSNDDIVCEVANHSNVAVSSLTTSDILFIETNTTGFYKSDEVVEIAIVDIHEKVLFQSLIKPSQLISKTATSIHGITNTMLINAPTFEKIYKKIKKTVKDKTLIFYNANFHTMKIARSVQKSFGYDKPLQFKQCFNNNVVCLMDRYAQWQKLINACYQQGIDISDLSNCRAVNDARKMVRLFKCYEH